MVDLQLGKERRFLGQVRSLVEFEERILVMAHLRVGHMLAMVGRLDNRRNLELDKTMECWGIQTVLKDLSGHRQQLDKDRLGPSQMKESKDKVPKTGQSLRFRNRYQVCLNLQLQLVGFL